MVSKKNFQLNNRIMPQQRPAIRAPAPYKTPYKAPIQLFSASQIPDDPGYVDFNNPTPPISNPVAGGTAATSPPQAKAQQNKKKATNNKMKQKVKQVEPINHANGINSGNWSKKNQHLLNGGNRGLGNSNGMQRGFNGVQPGIGMPIRGRGGRMVPPIPRGGPMAPIPPPIRAFQPPPMIPPMGAPVGRGPMPPIPPMANGPGPLAPPPRAYMHRNGHKMPAIPPPMPPIIMAPRMPRSAMPPVVPFNGSTGKIKKPNPKLIKKVVKSKSSIKTLKNLVNQYPLDKPWVTAELKAEHNKKVDIENRLKGNKNDELFAQFKAQRDKFVSMYESAREEYLKKEAAAVKSKDGGNKDNKQTLNKTADLKNGNQKVEALPQTNHTKNKPTTDTENVTKADP